MARRKKKSGLYTDYESYLMNVVEGKNDDKVLHDKWAYLRSNVMHARYAVASYWLLDVVKHSVIEIGAYHSPLWRMLPTETLYVPVDPLLPQEGFPRDNVIPFKGKINEFEKPEEVSDYALIFLGMDIKGEKDKKVLHQLMGGASVVLCGTPLDWEPSVEQLEEVKDLLGDPDMSVDMDFSNNRLPGKPYTRRQLNMWKKTSK